MNIAIKVILGLCILFIATVFYIAFNIEKGNNSGSSFEWNTSLPIRIISLIIIITLSYFLAVYFGLVPMLF